MILKKIISRDNLQTSAMSELSIKLYGSNLDWEMN